LRGREGIPSNHRYIILDTMMPKMDGYEFMRISRGDHNTLINQRSECISRFCIRLRRLVR